MKAFIDNVAMSVNGATSEIEPMVQCAKTQLQWWTQLIQASSGDFNPQKCCCTLYHWIPDTSGILYLNTVDPTIKIAPCPQQPQQTIPVLKPNEGTRYLGIYVTRSGDTQSSGTKPYFTPKHSKGFICPAEKLMFCIAPAFFQPSPTHSQLWPSQHHSSSASTNY